MKYNVFFISLNLFSIYPLLGSNYFRNDDEALNYVYNQENVFVAVSFPCMKINETGIEDILNHYGQINYKKYVKLTDNGSINFIIECYKYEMHSKSYLQQIHDEIFSEKNKIIISYVYTCKNLEMVREAKDKIRNIYKKKWVIHATDNHEQSIELARCLFLKNTLHFINNRDMENSINFPNFNKLLSLYKLGIKHNTESFVIDGSAVLSAYGIRDCHDIDYLTTVNPGFNGNCSYISDHLSELKFHKKELDDLIFNPDNFFYLDGIKFLTLQQISVMKKNRYLSNKDNKDLNDIKLISDLLNFKNRRILFKIDEIRDKKIRPLECHKDRHLSKNNLFKLKIEIFNQILKKFINNVEDLNNFTSIFRHKLENKHSEEVLERFFNKFHRKYQVIEIQEPLIINTEHDRFDETSLKKLLENAYKNKQLHNPDFEDVSCIKITDIFNEMRGDATKQLFLIKSQCANNHTNDYILKELAYGENAATNMKKAMKIKELKPFVNNRMANYPVLILPTVYLSYIIQKEKHILCLMNKAPGITLLQLMNEFAVNPSKQQIKKTAACYKQVGTSTAKFHQYFMRDKTATSLNTLIHSDFHIGNVLFDEITGQVSFIDNERLATLFYELSNPIHEILRLLIGPSNTIIPSENLSKGNKKRWIYKTFKNFIQGYLSVFSNQTVRSKIIDSLLDILKTTHVYTFYKKSIDDALFKANM
ncbi:hypothetical protein A3F66_06220 [candidate division TM6 bacterium RIFCSPHIGHO2_12_FULL_32_22]|nr:MAG: hypothetical protein A3F66_06220 [candidate division TM6 bacterium RIFCSPHIGHO2_12_FULL_32_22]